MANLSLNVWNLWEKSGRNDFLKSCKFYLKDTTKSPIFDKNGKVTPVVKNVNDLVMNGIKGSLKKEWVVSILEELVPLHADMPSLILETLNVADAATSVYDGQTEERSNYCAIVKECEKFLSDKLLKERLEIDTLQEVGILKNKNFYTKFIKVKTKLYYKQRKFNLFREESEGYSKLITELNQEFTDKITPEFLLHTVQALIGCFNLDPNRVLDVILESFEGKPEYTRVFVPLIKSYMNDPKIICEVLGFKYTFHKNNAENPLPHSLYMLTAQLLQNKLISLDEIYCWLTPDDKALQKETEKELKDAKEYVRKLQIISTQAKEKEDTPEEKDNSVEKYNNNQKFGLCEALLKIGDWDSAQALMKRLPDHLAIEQQPIAIALCNLLHYIIEPVYRRNCKLGNKIQRKSVPPHSNPLSPRPAETFVALKDHAIPMLITLGPSLRFDSVLMYKIIRIAKAALGNPSTKDQLYFDIISVLDSSILPSLSYMDCNCCVAEEIWNIVKLYPYQHRYCMYARWKNDTYQMYPQLMRKRGDAQKQIKNLMKRVSKENVKPVGRLIGKLTHCSPGFLFDYVLLQIQVYDNLIHPVVDSLKYLTSLSYDVLGYCLIESLTNADRNRFKHDSTSISMWLQSLSSFCGAIFKKYNIELTGLLQYVANQLKAQKSLDLLILKEIVQKMAGVEAAEDLTLEQMDAMAGGELLKSEAGYFSQIRNTKRSSMRLKDAMSEQNLAVTLCLLMAQQKYCVVYRETQNNHLKLVGKLSDQCQDTLVQFGTFLGSTLSVDEYVNKLPSIQSMLQDYHIPSEVAFFLARPMFNHAINIKYEQLRKADVNTKKSTALKQVKYHEACKEVMAPIVQSVQPLHSPKVWEDISPQFMVTFWSLTMYDLHVPVETYQQVIGKIKQQSLTALDSKDITPSKGRKEQERYVTLMEKLQDEQKKQHEHVDKVMYRLKQEKDTWFLSRAAKSAKNETITRFLQLCLFPRCTFTAVDAAYCAKFVHTIHMLKTANFSTLLCYDRLFCDVTYSVTSCTENEAMRYGRFLCAMLETVMRWHSSKTIYDQECANYPGFVTKYRVSNQFSDNNDHVGYENYRHVCHKWHYKLTKAMITCLDSKDYVQIRNALIILIKIIPYFPVLLKLSTIIEKKVDKVRDEEKNQRQDLYILALSYGGQLKNRVQSGNMIKEQDFHLNEKEKVVKSHDNSNKVNEINKHNGEAKTSERAESAKESIMKETKSDKTDKKTNSNRNSAIDQSPKNEKPTKSSVMISALQSTSNERGSPSSKDKNDKEKTPKDESRDIKHKIKEEKRDDGHERERDREREREKRRERKEEKMAMKEDRQYREDRYVEMLSPKEESRYSNERSQSDRYYSENERLYSYREIDRDMGVSGTQSMQGQIVRRSQEPQEMERDVKRRKVESSSSKSSKHEERKLQLQQQQQQAEYANEKLEKKERPSKSKDKREKISDEERELKKERKLGRKRDRNADAELLMQAEMKRRREEEKAAAKILSHQNGDMMESSGHMREKHHHTREKSPYQRERSHDRAEMRDKQRSTESKRR